MNQIISQTGDLAPITKTEFSTFTYLVTSVREDGNTLVETDIVVSSNIVTSTPGAVEATPVLEQVSLINIHDVNWELHHGRCLDCYLLPGQIEIIR